MAGEERSSIIEKRVTGNRHSVVVKHPRLEEVKTMVKQAIIRIAR
jgi:hypothetical protein